MNYTKSYEALKKKYETLIHNHTLEKYEVLNKAYEIGKKLHGPRFSIYQLAKDFGIPRTTAKRVLSLRKANAKTWKLIKSNKISAFKVAQICLSRNIVYQDEVVEAVIKDNLSTYEIKKFNIRGLNGLEAVRQQRLSLAMNKGFSRKNVASASLYHCIDRLYLYLEGSPDLYPTGSFPNITARLNNLKIKIDYFIKKIEDHKK